MNPHPGVAPKASNNNDNAIPGSISLSQASKQATLYAGQIFDNWNLLNSILDRHESTIQKRWSKKTRKQRQEILLAVWPNMTATHRADLQVIQRKNKNLTATGLADLEPIQRKNEFDAESIIGGRQAFMYPDINIEDLIKPRTLPLMLQSRARSRPDVFACMDQESIRIGLSSSAIKYPVLEGYIMILTGRTTTQTYGEVIPCNPNRDSIDLSISRNGTPPGLGLLVLEIQDRIMRFLVDFCKRVLHDITASDLASSKWPVQPRVVLRQDTVDGLASLAVIAEETPYRAPADMDLPRLTSFLEARRAAVEDHIWSLREDPGYFAGTLQDYRDHSVFMEKDLNDRSDRFLSAKHEDELWPEIVKDVLTCAHLALETWTEMAAQAQNLCELHSQYKDQITVDKDIPDEFFRALLKFHSHLCLARAPPLSKLKQALAAKAELGIVPLLNTLVNEGHSMNVYEFTMWVDEVERIIQNDSKVKALISPLVADILSEVSIVNESSRQLHNYQPWALTLNCALRENSSTFDEAFVQHAQAWKSIVVGCRSTIEKKTARLGEPIGARFYYPVDKKRNKDNVEAMRSAEKNLDAFWRAVDGDMLGRQQKLTALCRLISQDRALHRTPEWVEPEKASKQDLNDSITVPLSEMYLDLERRTEKTIDHALPAAKAARTKTRGTPTEPAVPAEPAEPEANLDAPVTHPTFSLDARALKVFRTLFYTPNIGATPGEIPWVDFLHAMVATGFRPEKLYGSVWQFSPSGDVAERSIQFHEPHPVGKLSYRVARRIGRRLNRAYGWEGKMFLSK